MTTALDRFHATRVIFEEAGIRPDGFSLPRQHALIHYVLNIKLFGSPNGLCSSITESKHIVAVKRPWRASNHHDALGQIIRINTRLNKLAAARVEFGRRGMLRGDIITHALREVARDAGLEPDVDTDLAVEGDHLDEDDCMAVDGPRIPSKVELNVRAGEFKFYKYFPKSRP